ncbi:DUF5667 domain-containing protein [Klenkia sp. LSe6-5]|uniref:DUF5667 domain-containing protein n=1 Tax=Klenkia sesuvii TaxID=3103137 RepID=A0ABU8DQQ6_9ACTN
MSDREVRAELEDALVRRLQRLPRDAPDLGADVRATQRARLVAMAAVREPAVRSPEPAPSWWRRALAARSADVVPPRWRTRVTAGLVGAAMSVGALSGLVAVAQDAEPGDLLYGLKRGSEQTQLALAADTERGLTLLGFATTRLQELQALTGSDAGAQPVAAAPGRSVAAAPDAGTVVDVLDTMDEQTTEGTSALTTTAVPARDTAALTTLVGWAQQQRAGLVGLDVPVGAEQAVADSLDLVDQVAARGAGLQASLACSDGAADAGRDSLGPVPGACLPAPSPAPTAAPSTGAPATPAPGSTAAPAPTTGPAPASTSTAASTPAARPTGGGAATTAPGVPGVPGAPGVPTVPLPTSAPTTTPGPLIEVPLPLPSTTICVGGLICVGD